MAEDEKHPNDTEYLYTVPEVAMHFGVTSKTVYSWINEKKIKFYRTPDKQSKIIPAGVRKSPLFTTRAAMAAFAEVKYRLEKK